MPLYDYKCPKCHRVKHNVLCNSGADGPSCCGYPMQQLFPISDIRNPNKVGGLIFPIQGVTIEHCANEPVFFRTRAEMKKFEKEHNMDIGA